MSHTQNQMPTVSHTVENAEDIRLPAIPTAARKLKVSIVSDAIAGRNGVGTYYLDLVQHLDNHLGAVDLIAPELEPDRQIERFALPMPGDRTQRLAWPKVHQLYARLDKLNPDVIVIPSLGAFSYYAMRYAKQRKKAFAIVNHTNFDHLLALYWPSWMVAPFRHALRSLNRSLCRQASGVAAMSADAFLDASEAGSTFTRVMGTPLSFDFMSTTVTPVQEQLKRCIFVGRLAEEKGIQKILDAARICLEIEFAIGGDGPLRNQVEEAAVQQSNLKYLGWISRDVVLNEIDRSQLLLLPSIYETFGTVALEALARKRFVLTSPDCGIASWPAFSSSIFTTHDPESLGQSIKRVAAMSHDDRVNLAEHGWNSVRLFNDNTIRTWLRFLCDTALNGSRLHN